MDKDIQTTIDKDGILLARIDMPGRAMNVFSISMMDSLERLLEHVEATPTIKGVVIASGKSTFLVGADLEMIRMFTEVGISGAFEDLHLLFGRLGRLFRRLERSAKPYVAAINGLALGGGLELSMACHERVVAEGKAVQLGLPEIKLGLLPGAGGTQRLPRLIGAFEAMRMLLSGEPVSPTRALELGLVQQVVSAEQLINTATRRALALTAPRAPWDTPGCTFKSAPFDFLNEDALEQIAAVIGVTNHQRTRYPAYNAIMQCVVDGWNRPMDEACHREMSIFVALIRSPVAGNMVRTLFLNRQRAVKDGIAPPSLSGAKIAVTGKYADTVRSLLVKAPLIEADELTEQDIVVLTDDPGMFLARKIAWLRDKESSFDVPGLWLADPTEHGRAAEVLVEDGNVAQADTGLKLAQWLRATVLVTSGQRALLPALQAAQVAARDAGCTEDEILLAVALTAASAWLEGGIADVEAVDVAAVLSGVHPAFTGGPFTFLRQMGVERVQGSVTDAAQRHPELFHLPPRSQDLFNALAAS